MKNLKNLGIILDKSAMKKIAGGYWGCHCDGGNNNGAVMVFSGNPDIFWVNQQAAELCWPGGGTGICTEYTT
mgnify:CR=1 FL=1|jgi:hypothetical protein